MKKLTYEEWFEAKDEYGTATNGYWCTECAKECADEDGVKCDATYIKKFCKQMFEDCLQGK